MKKVVCKTKQTKKTALYVNTKPEAAILAIELDAELRRRQKFN